MNNKKKGGIYATKGKNNLLFIRAVIDGVDCVVYMKGGQVISYDSWERVNRQFYNTVPLYFYTDLDGRIVPAG